MKFKKFIKPFESITIKVETIDGVSSIFDVVYGGVTDAWNARLDDIEDNKFEYDDIKNYKVISVEFGDTLVSDYGIIMCIKLDGYSK